MRFQRGLGASLVGVRRVTAEFSNKAELKLRGRLWGSPWFPQDCVT
jgi:hypothetical protein